MSKKSISIGLFLGGMSVGLGCQSNDTKTPDPIEKKAEVSTTEVSTDYWIYRLVDTAKLMPYIEDPGWQKYYTRDFAEVITFAKGDSLARFHLEHATVYRQALLMHVYATQKTILHKALGQQQKDTNPQIDPATVSLENPKHAYLLALSSVFLGDYAAAEKYMARVPASPEYDAHVVQWKTWLASDKKSPPQLSGFFFSAEGAGSNRTPEWNTDQYAFNMSDGSTYQATDATSLWLLSSWHQQQAETLLEGKSYQNDVIDQWLAPWRVPFESSFVTPTATKTLDLTDDWFLFGYYLSPEDMAFGHAISIDASTAVSGWKEKSVFAQNIALCIEAEKLNAECIKDKAEDLAQKTQAHNRELTKDIPIEQVNAELLYEIFPSFARYALLRTAAVYAFKTKQIDSAGYLMLEIREASGVVRDPVSLMFLTAYDAFNANTVRAPELLHEYADEFSALQSARIPLDFLQIQLTKDGSHIPTY